jgi:hypothetical protein
MSRLPLLALAVLLLAAPAARAAPADEATALKDFFTGTLEIDVPAGGPWSARRYLEPDHTYRETGSDGAVSGTWAVRDGKLCITADRPLGVDRAATYCNAILGKHAGDMWRDADPVTGNTVLFKLTPGRS